MLRLVVTQSCPATAGATAAALQAGVGLGGVAGVGGSVLSRLVLCCALKAAAVLSALAASRRPSSGAAATATAGGAGGEPACGQIVRPSGTPRSAPPMPATTTGRGRRGRGRRTGSTR